MTVPLICIVRDKDGGHTVNGLPFKPETSLYRKTALAQATRMSKPFSVQTLEGTMEGKAGDYLMVGVKGEMYPCDAEVFLTSYELAEKGIR